MSAVLDTDHLSILLRESQPATANLLARLKNLPEADVWTTIVCFQEQVQGWGARLNRARRDDQVLRAYGELHTMWRRFCEMKVLQFNGVALERFQSLRKKCRRVGTI